MRSTLLNSIIKLSVIFGAAVLLAVVLFGGSASAASVTYPTTGDSNAGGAINATNVHITASRQGNGIYLDAPYAVVKLKYSTDSTSLGVNITDACYWANVDGGSNRPPSCTSNQVTVNICRSDINGAYQDSYKGTGNCIPAQDPAGWLGAGQATRNFTFDPTSLNGIPAVDGYYNLFVIVTQNVAGLNGFKVGASSPGSRVAAGFAATSSGSQPMSLVTLPLSPSGSTDIRVNFAVPCGDTAGRFNLRWFDADRGPTGIPADYDIRFALYDVTPAVGGGYWTSGELAYISSQSEDQFLGANGAGSDRNVPLVDSAKMGISQNRQYQWHWTGVDSNNGVQVYVPYDEPDRIQGCPPPTATCTQTATTVQTGENVTFSTNSSSNYSWSGGGTPPTGTAQNFTTNWSTAGSRTVTIDSAAGSASCAIEVTAPQPPPSPCPNNPSFDPMVRVTMSNTAPPNSGPQSGATTQRSATYYERQRTGIQVVGSEDISNPSGGFDVNAVPTDAAYDLRVLNFSQSNPSGSATADLDYNIFLEQCPFDVNQGQILYRSYYEQQLWRSSSTVSYYQCNGYQPAYRSGSTCYYTYSATASCPYGYYLSGSTCYRWGRRTSSGFCSFYATTGDLCVRTASPSYYCSLGGSRSGTTCTYTYSATAYYNWYRSGSRQYDLWRPGSTNGDVMPPCFNRNFDMNGTLGTATLDGGNEEITLATFATNLSSTFTAPNPPGAAGKWLRRANQVLNYPARATYTIFNNDGSPPRDYSNAPRVTSGNCSTAATSNRLRNVLPPGISISDTRLRQNAFGTATRGHNDCLEAFAIPAGQLRAGDFICMTIIFDRPQGQVNHLGAIQSTTGAQRTVNHARTPGTPGCTGRLGDKPYFTVYGGDVLAGSGFKATDGSCTATAGSRIMAWNRGAAATNPRYGNSPYGGAGSRLAALAVGSIAQFVSAKARTNPGPPAGLTFANESGVYGGNWGVGNVGCSANYFAERQGTNFTDNTVADLNTRFATGSYQKTGDLVIGSGAPNVIPNGKRIVLYVDGDVHIRSPISYSGAFTSINDIPSLRIVARNIYIAPNVNNVEGVLIAQQNGATGGNVLTCSGAGNFSNPSATDLANGACRSNLTLRGALVARKVYLLRTVGSIRSSTANEASTSPNTAERIIFSPTVWLADPASDPINKEPYEAYTSMPPIL